MDAIDNTTITSASSQIVLKSNGQISTISTSNKVFESDCTPTVISSAFEETTYSTVGPLHLLGEASSGFCARSESFGPVSKIHISKFIKQLTGTETYSISLNGSSKQQGIRLNKSSLIALRDSTTDLLAELETTEKLEAARVHKSQQQKSSFAKQRYNRYWQVSFPLWMR